MKAYKNFGIYLTAINMIPIAIVTGLVNDFILETIIAVGFLLLCAYVVFPLMKKIYKRGSLGATFVLVYAVVTFSMFVVLLIMKLIEYDNGLIVILFMLLGLVVSWVYMKSLYCNDDYRKLINEYME